MVVSATLKTTLTSGAEKFDARSSCWTPSGLVDNAS